MSARETVAALMLAGALVLPLPCPLYASDTLPPSSALDTSALQARPRRISLAQNGNGTVVARPASSLENKKGALTWQIDVADTQGSSCAVELRIKNVQADELDLDSEIELVSAGPRPGLLRVGSVSKSPLEVQATYTLSVRLSGKQDAASNDVAANGPLLFSIGEQTGHGCLELKQAGAENLATARKEPSTRPLKSALTAPKDNDIDQVHKITSTWTDFTWSGSGSTELSLIAPSDNAPDGTEAGSSAPIQGSSKDAPASPDDNDGSDSSKASSDDPTSKADAAPAAGAAQGNGSGLEETTVSVDARGEVAQAMGAATDIDPANFTAAVALDGTQSLEASAPVEYAADEPVRQRIILSVPKTFELVFLPSGEVVAPTALTVLGGERAYNDIKDMTLTDKATQATLELYAPEDDGSLSKEFDGTTFLKGYRRLGLKEDISYTAKLKGLDYRSEQDLVMAAIETPQHLFTFNVVFMPIIP